MQNAACHFLAGGDFSARAAGKTVNAISRSMI
jgi:hypothetical protein